MAYHGHRVKIYDVNPAALSTVQANLEDDKNELRKDGLMMHPTFLVQFHFQFILPSTPSLLEPDGPGTKSIDGDFRIS